MDDGLYKIGLKNYYISFNLSMFAFGLVSVFLNLLFFSQGSYLDVIYFNLATYFFLPITFALSGYLLDRYRPKHLYAIGELAIITVFASLFIFSNFVSNVIIFGSLFGIASGMFWAGNNMVGYDMTRNSDRSKFISTNNLLSGIAGLVAPLVAGVLIQYSGLPGKFKFLWDFAAACVFLIMSAVFILRVKSKEKRLKFSLRETIVKNKGEYAKFKVYYVLRELCMIPCLIILPIYVFQVTGSILAVGVFASYVIIMSVLANLAVIWGFRISGNNTVLAIFAIIGSTVFLLVPSIAVPPINVFIFAGIFTILTTPLDNSANAEFMGLIDRNSDINRAMFWINNEYYLGIGRILMLMVLATAVIFLQNSLDMILVLPVASLYSFTYLTIDKKTAEEPFAFANEIYIHYKQWFEFLNKLPGSFFHPVIVFFDAPARFSNLLFSSSAMTFSVIPFAQKMKYMLSMSLFFGPLPGIRSIAHTERRFKMRRHFYGTVDKRGMTQPFTFPGNIFRH